MVLSNAHVCTFREASRSLNDAWFVKREIIRGMNLLLLSSINYSDIKSDFETKVLRSAARL